MVLRLSRTKVETVNTLTIPKNRPVVFKLQAMDTMTSFWIPQLGGQKYAMTGMTMNGLYKPMKQVLSEDVTQTLTVKVSLAKRLKFTL